MWLQGTEVFTCLVKPVMLYGLEVMAWTKDKTFMKRKVNDYKRVAEFIRIMVSLRSWDMSRGLMRGILRKGCWNCQAGEEKGQSIDS